MHDYQFDGMQVAGSQMRVQNKVFKLAGYGALD